jgi:hypothetical protein
MLYFENGSSDARNIVLSETLGKELYVRFSRKNQEYGILGCDALWLGR